MEGVSGFGRLGGDEDAQQRQPNLAAPERFSSRINLHPGPLARRRRRGRRLRERPASLPDSSLARRSKPRPAGAIGRSVKPLDRPGQTCQSGAMASFPSSDVCQNCGAITQRWQGKCESCGEWNTIIEEAAALGDRRRESPRRGAAARPFPLEELAGAARPEPRLITGIAELDRVAGGGFVPGSTTLIGGEPGIGKSTLAIQACAAVARSGGRVVYVSGEELTAQVRLRAARLGLADAPVQLAAQTFVEDIVATLGSGDAPKFVVIDLIQTMWSDAIELAPGTVSQVRGSAQALIRFAKASGAALLIARPCHQGRPDRRPAGRRAYGRRGLLLRGRRRACLPPAAGGQEPVRRDRRSRHFRDDRRRPRRSAEPVGALLGGSRWRRQSGRGGVRWRRGSAPSPGRDPGPGGADDAWHAAPRGGRLGAEPAGDGLAVLQATEE